MKSITIKGSKRESVGKVATKALRNAGRVPSVLYGGGEPLHFSVPELDFSDGAGFWGAFKRWMGLPAREVAG